MSSSCAFATTHLTPELQNGLRYWWDFQDPAEVPPVDFTNSTVKTHWNSSFNWPTGQNYGQIVATAPSPNVPWAKDATTETGTSTVDVLASSFTLSFDIKNLSSEVDKDVFSLYTNNGTLDNNKLCLHTGAGDSLSLNSNGFGSTNLTTDPNTGSISAGSGSFPAADQWTTFTITSDGTTITLYKDGVSMGELACTIGADTKITGIQFGKAFGADDTPEKQPDTHNINSADVDNIGIWQKALTAEEVQSLTIPEPTTASLCLFGLATLILRRRK
ncbi:MAG: LamG-like jellyroll fold domain-containing protein [Akkermansia sp.]